MRVILKYCSDPAIRKQMMDDRVTFASSGEFDNRPIILEILTLRDRKARILGYENYAELSLQPKMAETPEQVIELISDIQSKGTIKAREEIAEIRAYMGLGDQGKDGKESVEIGYADLAYWKRRYKEEKFQFDDQERKQYFPYEQTRDGMFAIAGKLYGLEFRPAQMPEAQYHELVEVYEVWRKGELVSYFLLDLFYREGKRPGACADPVRIKHLDSSHDITPLLINLCNFHYKENGTTLLTEIEVETMFHEFGHALSQFLHTSTYAALGGMRVERDCVEIASQLMENRTKSYESLKTFATHYKTGEILPRTFFEKMKAKNLFGGGYRNSRHGEVTLLDMYLYTNDIPGSVDELDVFVTSMSSDIGLFARDSETYKMHASFAHVFSRGYAAGYYSYLRAEIIEAQIFAEFEKNGVFDEATARRYVDTILGPGSLKPAAELLEDFAPGGIDQGAFMRKYGLK